MLDMEIVTYPFDIVFDMETSDPDDVCTLCFLCQNPLVNLRAVTVTPGTKEQVYVVREFLRRCGKSTLPVGARKPDHAKPCVSGPIEKYLGTLQREDPTDTALNVLTAAFRDYPDATLLTGAPLTNARALLGAGFATYRRWVVQGGFAGDSVVPEEHRLSKFAGKETCPTFNFNGDREAAKTIAGPCSRYIDRRLFVSKNVCHGVSYDIEIHRKMKAVKKDYPGWTTLMSFMDSYLENHGCKLFHDPLAAAVAINENICDFREVEFYTEKGEWGTRPKEGTNAFISVSVNKPMFWAVLAGHPI